MHSKVTTPEMYFAELPEDRKQIMTQLRSVIKKNLPKGFEEQMSYGMVGYVVPHKLYSEGYHCDPNLPLPFLSLASQKNFIAIYHMGLYADPSLLHWFTTAYKKEAKTRLDMGKSCIRFKKPEHVPLKLIGELAGKMTPKEWINIYDRIIKGRK